MSGDEFLKNTFANNAFEKFEIAAYTSLLSLCRRRRGRPRAARTVAAGGGTESRVGRLRCREGHAGIRSPRGASDGVTWRYLGQDREPSAR
ncbi:hypothetical protein [Bradyrhizobium sp. SZCCHNRI3043]|uniref:hypothetical protein n=1 Tax=Bradyrhizobium sp. SZCCHNRI3043 TaxID=3057292 RepID=UPI0028EB8EA0|nr:hypothetical protein [Bradyrhizobium sp. SZCCHNRI3043]